MKIRNIAFTGYARSGKDTAAVPLIERGWQRLCFGDIIKRQVGPLTAQYLGISSRTEDDLEKTIIRPLLETWGEVNYDGVMQEFFRECEKYECVVNTRLVRVREANEWRRRGGIIVLIERPGVGPATNWERDMLFQLCDARLIDYRIENTTVEHLHKKVLALI